MIERPIGYEHEKRDCLVVALAIAADDIGYAKVHKAWKLAGRRDGMGFRGIKHLNKVCELLGLKAKKVAWSGTVRKLIKKHPKGRYFCIKRGHAFAVVDGCLNDETRLGSHIKSAWRITK